MYSRAQARAAAWARRSSDEGSGREDDVRSAFRDVDVPNVVSLDGHATRCRRAVEHVHAVEMRHLARIETALQRYPGVVVLGDARPDARVVMLSFTTRGLPVERVADELDADHGVCARAGLQCAPLVHVDAGTSEAGGTLRLSPGYFTDEADMAQLLEAFEAVLGNGRAERG